MMPLEQMVGQQLMIGVQGASVTPQVLEIFRKTHACGLILFRSNFFSPQKLKDFVSNLEESLQRKLLIAVDHEGGRVIHLGEAVTVFPDNWCLGNTGNEEYAAQQGMIEAKELRRLGIDLNLAPTLDVLTEIFSPNIGIRSYGKDPELVARLGKARIQAMQSQGLSACAKHFPGLGQSPLDPHLNLPVLPTTWDEMKKIHLKPFLAAMEAGVDTMMTSHPVYPNLDSEKVPVTFSKKIVKEFLRDKLNFQGVILTDDLEMGALRGLGSIGEAACRAVQAGHDMVLACHDSQAQQEIYNALLKAYQTKDLDIRQLEASCERIENLKKRRKERFASGEPHQETDGNKLASKIAREGVSLSSRHAEPPLFNPSSKIAVIFPKLSSLNEKFWIEEELLNENEFVKNLFAKQGVSIQEICVISFDPSEAEIQKAIAASQSAEITVFFCYDAHLFPNSRKLLKEIQRSAKSCVVILLRDPYDEEWVEPQTACVFAYGFRVCQIKAAVELLFKSKKRGQVVTKTCPLF